MKRVEERYLSKYEAAKYLNCCLRTIDHWMADGLPHFKVSHRKVLFKQSEIDEFLTKRFKRILNKGGGKS